MLFYLLKRYPGLFERRTVGYVKLVPLMMSVQLQKYGVHACFTLVRCQANHEWRRSKKKRESICFLYCIIKESIENPKLRGKSPVAIFLNEIENTVPCDGFQQ